MHKPTVDEAYLTALHAHPRGHPDQFEIQSQVRVGADACGGKDVLRCSRKIGVNEGHYTQVPKGFGKVCLDCFENRNSVGPHEVVSTLSTVEDVGNITCGLADRKVLKHRTWRNSKATARRPQTQGVLKSLGPVDRCVACSRLGGCRPVLTLERNSASAAFSPGGPQDDSPGHDFEA